MHHQKASTKDQAPATLSTEDIASNDSCPSCGMALDESGSCIFCGYPGLDPDEELNDV